MQTHRYDGGHAILGVPRALAEAYSFKRAQTSAMPASLSVERALDPVAVIADVPTQRWLATQTQSSPTRCVGYTSLRTLPVRPPGRLYICLCKLTSAPFLISHTYSEIPTPGG